MKYNYLIIWLLPVLTIFEKKVIYNEPEDCNCHCRIGHYKGQQVNEYPNPVKDIGIVESWGGILGATNSRSQICKKRCYDASLSPLILMPKSEYCSKSERFLSGQNKEPMNRLFVYYKVGGRKWQICNSRFEKCE